MVYRQKILLGIILSVTFLGFIGALNRVFADSPVQVGLPCTLRTGNTLSNINQNRAHNNINGLSDKAHDLQAGDECADDKVIASIGGQIEVFTQDDTAYCKDDNGNYIKNPAINTVIRITRSDGVKALYYHHSPNYTPTVADGQVLAGEVLTTISDIGCATGPHIHFEVRQGSTRLTHSQWEYVETYATDIASPQDNAFVRDLTVELQNVGSAATAYHVQVSRNSGFSPNIYSMEKSTHIHTIPLENGGIMYIRARIKKSDGSYGPWTATRTVKVETIPVNMAYFNGKFIETTRSAIGRVVTRTSNDGITWSAWTSETDYGKKGVSLVVFAGKVFQFRIGEFDTIHSRYSTDGTTWSTWTNDTSMPVKHEVDLIVFGDKLIQTITKPNNIVNTRYSTDGLTWSNWYESGGTYEPVTSEVLNGTLYQSVAGTNNVLYTRTSTDGVTWSGWENQTAAAKSVTLKAFDSKLYQTVVQPDNKVSTRYLSAGTWSNWQVNGGTFLKVSMQVFNNALYQSVLGTNEKAYTRRTIGALWTPWHLQGGGHSEPRLFSLEGKLHQTISDKDAVAWHRMSEDGIFDTKPEYWESQQTYALAEVVTTASMGNVVVQASRNTSDIFVIRHSFDGTNWSAWSESGGGIGKASLVSFKGKIYEYIADNTANHHIWSRSTSDGVNWSGWIEDTTGISTTKEIGVVSNGAVLIQTITKPDGKVNTRHTLNGTSWTAWYENGGANSDVDSELVAPTERFYQVILGSDNNIYTRYFDYINTTWSGWAAIGKSSTIRPTLEYFNGVLYLSFVNSAGKLETGYLNASGQWTGWTETSISGLTFVSTPAMETFSDKIYQSLRTNNNLVQTRHSTDGVTWSSWVTDGGGQWRVDLHAFGAQLLQTVVGTDNNVWTRKTKDSVFDKVLTSEDEREGWRQ
jgi:murein DD-endopeptidase MepM/ murein hydrolase activator NlpD